MDVTTEKEDVNPASGLPCPICGEPTAEQLQPARSASRRRRRGVLRAFSEVLYHQRYCKVCSISFEVSALENFLWRHFPILLSINPPEDEERRDISSTVLIAPSGTLHLPQHLTARAEGEGLQETQIVTPETRPNSPISIDPINRTVSISLACDIADGDFADQMSLAIQSLEKHLRQAADQIHLLSEATGALGLGAPAVSPASGTDSPKAEIDPPETDTLPGYHNAHEHRRRKFRRRRAR